MTTSAIRLQAPARAAAGNRSVFFKREIQMTHDEMIEVILAYRNGKAVQFRSEKHHEWSDACVPGFNFVDYEYRVTPTLQYVWMNVYRGDDGRLCLANAMASIEECKRHAQNAMSCCVGRVRVELVEGRFDD